MILLVVQSASQCHNVVSTYVLNCFPKIILRMIHTQTKVIAFQFTTKKFLTCLTQMIIYSRLLVILAKTNRKMSKKIQSVMGPISPDDLGVTFCHEHLSMDYEEAAFTAPASRDQHKPLCNFSIENLGWIRQVKGSREVC